MIIRTTTQDFRLDAALALQFAQSLGAGGPAATTSNDRFAQYCLQKRVDVVYDVTRNATPQDIARARAQQWFRVRETRLQYDTLVVPALERHAQRDVWVRNVLDGTHEADRVILRDADWLLVRDPKFADTCDLDQLYYLALFHDVRLRSLRDLSGEHLPLLRRVMAEATARVREAHFEGNAYVQAQEYMRAQGVELARPPQLVMFVQYHPTFWYLHVHVVTARSKLFTDWAGEAVALIALDRMHKLEDVIEKLELREDYYADAVLSTLVRGEARAGEYGLV